MQGRTAERVISGTACP